MITPETRSPRIDGNRAQAGRIDETQQAESTAIRDQQQVTTAGVRLFLALSRPDLFIPAPRRARTAPLFGGGAE
jgi:hypothetical protein